MISSWGQNIYISTRIYSIYVSWYEYLYLLVRRSKVKANNRYMYYDVWGKAAVKSKVKHCPGAPGCGAFFIHKKKLVHMTCGHIQGYF